MIGILISTQPNWVSLILNGIKAIQKICNFQISRKD